MGKALTKSKVGRPTKLDDNVATKLESIFKIGGNMEEACSYAGISTRTYQRWIEDDSDFVVKMTAAQHYADIAAKNVVTESIVKDKNLGTAKWWLEKREFKQTNQTNVQINMSKVLGDLEAE